MTSTEEGYVLIWETSDSAVLPVIESVLDAAGIPFLVQGEEAFGILPLGEVGGAGFFEDGIQAKILVPAERAEEARKLIESRAIPTGPHDDGGSSGEA